jgi:hypothetical protein
MEGIMKFFYHISVFGANAGFYIGGLLIHFWTIYITRINGRFLGLRIILPTRYLTTVLDVYLFDAIRLR